LKENKMPICLGIDPDSRYIAMAIGSVETVLGVYSKKVPGTGKGGLIVMIDALTEAIPEFIRQHNLNHLWPSTIIIEGQRIYPKSKARPNDLIKLAVLAGAIAGICVSLYPSKRILIPQPREWKGTVEKYIYQARMYQQLGWDYVQHKKSNYSHPKNPTVGKTINMGEWKHVGDAIGLMMWGACLDTPD